MDTTIRKLKKVFPDKERKKILRRSYSLPQMRPAYSGSVPLTVENIVAHVPLNAGDPRFVQDISRAAIAAQQRREDQKNNLKALAGTKPLEVKRPRFTKAQLNKPLPESPLQGAVQANRTPQKPVPVPVPSSAASQAPKPGPDSRYAMHIKKEPFLTRKINRPDDSDPLTGSSKIKAMHVVKTDADEDPFHRIIPDYSQAQVGRRPNMVRSHSEEDIPESWSELRDRARYGYEDADIREMLKLPLVPRQISSTDIGSDAVVKSNAVQKVAHMSGHKRSSSAAVPGYWPEPALSQLQSKGPVLLTGSTRPLNLASPRSAVPVVRKPTGDMNMVSTGGTRNGPDISRARKPSKSAQSNMLSTSTVKNLMSVSSNVNPRPSGNPGHKSSASVDSKKAPVSNVLSTGTRGIFGTHSASKTESKPRPEITGPIPLQPAKRRV